MNQTDDELIKFAAEQLGVKIIQHDGVWYRTVSSSEAKLYAMLEADPYVFTPPLTSWELMGQGMLAIDYGEFDWEIQTDSQKVIFKPYDEIADWLIAEPFKKIEEIPRAFWRCRYRAEKQVHNAIQR